MIRAIIIEDEMMSRLYLQGLLATWCPAIEVVAIAADCDHAVSAINELKPDLAFLDIELLSCTAFDVIKMLKGHYPKIIFTTALGDAALKIIKPSGIFFLQKPIDSDDLLEVMDKLSLLNELQHLQQLQQIIQTLDNEYKPQTIFTEFGNEGYCFISTASIVSIEAVSNLCNFVLADGNNVTAHNQTIKDCESFLCANNFLRVSQKHIVNTAFIESLHTTDEPFLLLTNGACIAVSSKKIDAIRSFVR